MKESGISATIHRGYDRLAKPTDRQIVKRLLERGIGTVVSVPCSITSTIDSQWQELASRGRMNLVRAVNEHSLPGMAAGIYFGTGEVSLIHMQNSGFPNAADGIVSFAKVYEVPTLAMVTWRGSNLIDDSEPHQEIGKMTDDLTKLVAGKENNFGMKDGRGFLRRLDKAIQRAQAGGISVVRLSPDAFEKTYPLSLMPNTPEPDEEYQARHEQVKREKGSNRAEVLRQQPISRAEAMREINQRHPDAAIVYANGFNSREAQAHADRKGSFYNAGYMGGALAIGWGIAMSNPDIEVVVVDGDQNAQMGGHFQSVLADNYPANLQWYILDNGIGASVGIARSIPLPPEYYWRAKIVRTVQDGLPGEFTAPRVRAQGEYFDTEEALNLAQEIGPLPAIAIGFRQWIEQKTRVNRETRMGMGVFSKVANGAPGFSQL